MWRDGVYGMAFFKSRYGTPLLEMKELLHSKQAYDNVI